WERNSRERSLRRSMAISLMRSFCLIRNAFDSTEIDAPGRRLGIGRTKSSPARFRPLRECSWSQRGPVCSYSWGDHPQGRLDVKRTLGRTRARMECTGLLYESSVACSIGEEPWRTRRACGLILSRCRLGIFVRHNAGQPSSGGEDARIWDENLSVFV